MTRRRWIADEVKEGTAALTGDNAAHLARVLRAQVGQQFDLSTGARVHLATVTSVSDERVEFELGQEVVAAPSVPITLFLAVIKFDRFEWSVEKCTELGCRRIVPVVTRRTESHLSQAAAKRVERWRKIAREAAQQSRAVTVLEIADPVRLKNAFPGEAGIRIVLNENESGVSLTDVLSRDTRPESLALAIGPEGGWTEDELALFEEHGWTSATLGPTILRAETAAIAAIAIVRTLLL